MSRPTGLAPGQSAKSARNLKLGVTFHGENHLTSVTYCANSERIRRKPVTTAISPADITPASTYNDPTRFEVYLPSVDHLEAADTDELIRARAHNLLDESSATRKYREAKATGSLQQRDLKNLLLQFSIRINLIVNTFGPAEPIERFERFLRDAEGTSYSNPERKVIVYYEMIVPRDGEYHPGTYNSTELERPWPNGGGDVANYFPDVLEIMSDDQVPYELTVTNRINNCPPPVFWLLMGIIDLPELAKAVRQSVWHPKFKTTNPDEKISGAMDSRVLRVELDHPGLGFDLAHSLDGLTPTMFSNYPKFNQTENFTINQNRRGWKRGWATPNLSTFKPIYDSRFGHMQVAPVSLARVAAIDLMHCPDMSNSHPSYWDNTQSWDVISLHERRSHAVHYGQDFECFYRTRCHVDFNNPPTTLTRKLMLNQKMTKEPATILAIPDGIPPDGTTFGPYKGEEDTIASPTCYSCRLVDIHDDFSTTVDWKRTEPTHAMILLADLHGLALGKINTPTALPDPIMEDASPRSFIRQDNFNVRQHDEKFLKEYFPKGPPDCETVTLDSNGQPLPKTLEELEASDVFVPCPWDWTSSHPIVSAPPYKIGDSFYSRDQRHGTMSTIPQRLAMCELKPMIGMFEQAVNFSHWEKTMNATPRGELRRMPHCLQGYFFNNWKGNVVKDLDQYVQLTGTGAYEFGSVFPSKSQSDYWLSGFQMWLFTVEDKLNNRYPAEGWPDDFMHGALHLMMPLQIFSPKRIYLEPTDACRAEALAFLRDQKRVHEFISKAHNQCAWSSKASSTKRDEVLYLWAKGLEQVDINKQSNAVAAALFRDGRSSSHSFLPAEGGSTEIVVPLEKFQAADGSVSIEMECLDDRGYPYPFKPGSTTTCAMTLGLRMK